MSKAKASTDPRLWLGSTEAAGTLLIVLFIPSRDRTGKPISHSSWVTRGLETLGTLFRGATAYPRARGVWRDDQKGGQLVYEEPTIVTCYAAPAALTKAACLKLRAFLHSMGRETRQGEVGIVMGDKYYGITEFDEFEH